MAMTREENVYVLRVLGLESGPAASEDDGAQKSVRGNKNAIPWMNECEYLYVYVWVDGWVGRAVKQCKDELFDVTLGLKPLFPAQV